MNRDKAESLYSSSLDHRARMRYALLSLLGAALLLAGFLLYLIAGADGLGFVAISITFLLTALSLFALLIGCAASVPLWKRRFATKRRLFLGGTLPLPGALGAGLFAAASVLLDAAFGYESGIYVLAQAIMSLGGFLCFAFGLLLRTAYRPE